MKFAGRTDVSLVREFFTLNKIPPTRENFARFFDRYVFWLDHILAQSQTRECPRHRSFLRDLRTLRQPPLLGLLTGNIRLGAEINCGTSACGRIRPGRVCDDHEDRDQIAHAAWQRGARVLREKSRATRSWSSATPRWTSLWPAIGAKVLAVATGGHEFEHLKAGAPDWVVKDLTEVKVEASWSGERMRGA